MVARGLLGSGCRTIKFGGKGKDAGSFRLKMFDTPRTIKHVRFDKHWIAVKFDCEVEKMASQKAQAKSPEKVRGVIAPAWVAQHSIYTVRDPIAPRQACRENGLSTVGVMGSRGVEC